MLRRAALRVLLFFLFADGVLYSAESVSAKTMRIDSAITSLPTEQLIDRLQDEAPGDPNRRWPALATAFLPLDAPARFEQNLARDARSPVMAELVRRGVDAVPVLLDHLTDRRPTQLVRLHQPNMVNDGGTWFSDTYDPRQAGTTYDTPGVNHEVDFSSSRKLPAGASYLVKVGDLCFVALGQIVNRGLLLEGSVVKNGSLYARSTALNSPVEFPALAAAARKDWTTLTRAEHEQMLESDAWENDALSISSGRSYGALQRLLFYYPDNATPVVKALLNRDLVDSSAVYEMLDQLQSTPTEQRLGLAIRYRMTHSAAEYDAMLRVAVRGSRRPGDHPVLAQQRQRYHDLVNSISPGHFHAPIDHINAVTYNDQSTLVEALAPFTSQDLDDSVFALFTRASNETPATIQGRFYRDQLALSCAKRLKHTTHAQDCVLFLRGEILGLGASLSAAQRDPSFNQPHSDVYQYRVMNYAINEWLANAKKVLSD